MSTPRGINLTGQRFFKLTAIRDTGRRVESSNAAIWECLCECGNTTFSDAAALRCGKRKSCGCFLKTQFACSFPGCADPAKAKNLCNRHYKREFTFAPKTSYDIAERFSMKTKAMPNGCIEWIGFINPRTGYGQTSYRGVKMGAHRLAWIMTHGPIPSGLWVCHKCDNPPCVNAEHHLFLGTCAENTRDGIRKGRINPRVTGGIRHV